MIKRIPIGDLRLGMYIHNLNRNWIDHSFVRNKFKLTSTHQLEEVHRLGVQEIFIDTDKGADVIRDAANDTSVAANPPNDSTSVPSISHQTMDEKLGNQAVVQTIALGGELENARAVRYEAQRAVKSLMEDVRLGRQLKVERAEQVVSNMVDSVLRNKDALLSLDLIRHRDRYTFQHSVAVATLMIAFGRELGMGREQLHKLGVGGLLHDLGKANIPNTILNKPGRLTDDEFALMRQHVTYGCEMAQTQGLDPEIIQIIRQHHERIDGSGYPDNLIGEEISLCGQMAGIVDVYDALASNRVYHQGEAPTAVLKMLMQWTGSHFHEELVQRFIHTVGIYPVGSLVRLENGYLAVVIGQGKEGLLYPTLRVMFNTGNGNYIQPYVIELSDDSSGTQKIVSYENPAAWGISPHVFV